MNGGTLNAAVVSTTPFQTLYVYVGSKTVGLVTEAAGGVDGYYELRLPSTQTTTTALLAFAQTIPLPEFELLFAVADASGAIGPFVGLSTTVTSVGTGDVQVTLSWDANADVDLHVVDPAGEEIPTRTGVRRAAASSNLDSNAGCAIDGIRNENITWPVGQAPRGQYTVRVDYWRTATSSRPTTPFASTPLGACSSSPDRSRDRAIKGDWEAVGRLRRSSDLWDRPPRHQAGS